MKTLADLLSLTFSLINVKLDVNIYYYCLQDSLILNPVNIFFLDSLILNPVNFFFSKTNFIRHIPEGLK